MLEKLVIATANKHKLKEIESLFKGTVIKEILLMPSDIGEIIEDGSTFIENSLIKAKTVYNHTKLPSLADDSGLCVNALGGKPGIYSARYGGENLGYKEKMQMLLDELKDKKDRTAYFITSAVCVLDDNYYIAVEGRVNGKIIENPRGFDGFGYDPIFQPDGYNVTYAEMSLEEKNSMSHRALAMNKMKDILSCISNY
ncbi:RdgB/HAM1 family non-canonical purine NTP pyrophosphatase [Brachyspira hyodysenteriae]|uniref:RdgB/HAM1 family non-canonical purine NTP pyrophosphatase n=1 Tax=Brachyspira hyodysenteriae TaxID=159 RepID=UPI001ADDE05D|nr:RdgB/HAM1 family non-canonical purine NTP pyrophosphatase [Brachyspira hyodysenteriae]MCZ9920254.1 RdgB/HAM1 family non-canonical purine NTP pyrophosphatase [Brachyspira hyodysenteriae]MCZ9939822.1 RdgB/HAM1 family non-canonical purine NTP pyrophosphatase [Brachyspira hyodysenteriae]MCZ9964971.1 RdgB/HAM1 family non-canonical purine NTP pyrophosphatase [Brachyspira hyodysenteriae]MDA0081444.1 RdgB/HAM1 family non-canonical purine NTP pyrophosphatase [Brachyspira hyodysenteriae]MDA0158128.1 